MFRIFMLSSVLVGVIYFIPFFTGDATLEEISIPTISEFDMGNLSFFDSDTDEKNMDIPISINGQTIYMDIDEYLIGVVSAEMPASFEDEALKAQAVAGRTYVYYKQDLMDNGRADTRHIDAVVCDDYTHCKAFVDLDSQNPWGDKYDIYKAKISGAVYDTSHEIVVYNQEPIAAVFHAVSSESTEQAVDVWGNEVPYLQAVSSYGGEASPNYKSSLTVSNDDFKKIILDNYSGAVFGEDNKGWFKASTRSESGGVISVYIGDVLISGTSVRSMFSLNSTNFTVEMNDDDITFYTTGYGHGVGMSQYGANALAKDGYTYDEIIAWYYTDTEIITK